MCYATGALAIALAVLIGPTTGEATMRDGPPPAVAGSDTVRFRITGEASEVSEVCSASGNCPTDEARETWTVTITPAGAEVEGEIETLFWGIPNADEWFEPCYVAGHHKARFHLEDIEWWPLDETSEPGLVSNVSAGNDWPAKWNVVLAAFHRARARGRNIPDAALAGELNVPYEALGRVALRVWIRPTDPPSRGATAKGSCPQVIPHSDGHRPYDATIHDLENWYVEGLFVPDSPDGRTLVRVDAGDKDNTFITDHRVEFLEGDYLRADPGGPYRVTRGERLTLDGSGSRGHRLRYEWSLLPTDCPDLGLAEIRLEGARPELEPFCSLSVRLAVFDGTGSDDGTTTVTVEPRKWRTPFEHVEDEGPLDAKAPSLRRTSPAGQPVTYEAEVTGGMNVSAHDGHDLARETLYPRRENGTWDGRGYTLEQVGDGPFAGIWYVAEYAVEVKRGTLINKFMLRDGPPLRAGSFYEKNREEGGDIDGYLEAIRGHEGMSYRGGELGHSGLIRKALLDDDPAIRAEAMLDRSRDALRNRLDDLLRKTDAALCKASADPLPLIWSGRVAFPYDDLSGWELVRVQIGGQDEGYRNMMSCD